MKNNYYSCFNIINSPIISVLPYVWFIGIALLKTSSKIKKFINISIVAVLIKGIFLLIEINFILADLIINGCLSYVLIHMYLLQKSNEGGIKSE